MSYQPTNWKTGDIITQEKLNKLEHRVFVIECNWNEETQEFVLNKTFQQIYDAWLMGNLCIIQRQVQYGSYIFLQTGIITNILNDDENSEYKLVASSSDDIGAHSFSSLAGHAESFNDYPIMNID